MKLKFLSLALVLCAFYFISSAQEIVINEDTYYINNFGLSGEENIEYFWSTNEQGYNFLFQVLSDTTAALTNTMFLTNGVRNISYTDFNYDTLYIPEYSYRGDSILKVVSLFSMSHLFDFFDNVTTIYIPKSINQLEYDNCSTIDEICEEFYLEDGFMNVFYGMDSLKNIHIDPQNEYYCDVDGVVYSKNRKRLVCYPSGRTKASTITIPEGVQILGPSAFQGQKMQNINLPHSLKKLCGQVLFQSSVKELVLKDSVKYIGRYAVPWKLNKLVISTQDSLYINDSQLVPKELYLYSILPPRLPNRTFHFREQQDSISLFVPRNSISLYRADTIWGQFAHIYPIEPPIVVGMNEAEVSWIQNFSATGYQWILYTDPDNTQMYVTINFDSQGQFTGIVLPSLAPARRTNGNTQQYEDYYSFTVTGLTPNTSYYYVQNALNGSEVISSESGSFTTLSNTSAGIEEATEEGSAPIKYLKDGRIYIRRNGIIYDASGVRVK